MKYVLILIAILFSGQAMALNCEKQPTCEELNYSKEDNPACKDDGYILCPFDFSYKKCAEFDCEKLGFTKSDKSAWCSKIAHCITDNTYTACTDIIDIDCSDSTHTLTKCPNDFTVCDQCAKNSKYKITGCISNNYLLYNNSQCLPKTCQAYGDYNFSATLAKYLLLGSSGNYDSDIYTRYKTDLKDKKISQNSKYNLDALESKINLPLNLCGSNSALIDPEKAGIKNPSNMITTQCCKDTLKASVDSTHPNSEFCTTLMTFICEGYCYADNAGYSDCPTVCSKDNLSKVNWSSPSFSWGGDYVNLYSALYEYGKSCNLVIEKARTYTYGKE